jgi:hypothetical protein
MKKWMLSAKALVLGTALVVAQGCGQQGSLPTINGVKGPIFNVTDGKIILTMKFTNLVVDGGAQLPIPHTRESYVSLGPNALDGGTMLEMTLAPNDLVDLNIGVGDGNTLPDGRPLPGVPGGTLQDSLRIDTVIGGKDIAFYLHKTVFGFSVPFGFETAGVSGYWNLTMNSKAVGFLGIVGSEAATGKKAQGVVLLNIASLQDKQLKKLINLSKRNPHFVY